MYKVSQAPENMKIVDTPWNSLYCIILALWSTIMVEMWKRKEHEIAHLWHMKGYKGVDSERPDYKADYVVDSKTKIIKKRSTTNTYLRRLLIELPTVCISIAVVVGFFIGYSKYKLTYTDDINSYGSAIVNALIIIILGVIYK